MLSAKETRFSFDVATTSAPFVCEAEKRVLPLAVLDVTATEFVEFTLVE